MIFSILIIEIRNSFKSKMSVSIVFEEPELFEEPDQFNVCLKKGFRLYHHQIDAVKWMKNREQISHHGITGGILALTMGLGKTITCLELCMSDGETEYPNLVICSKTVVYEWKRDIAKFFGDSCPFLFFHGTEKQISDITMKRLKKYKIIITTYETAMTIAKKENIDDKVLIKDENDRRVGVKSINSHNLNINTTGINLLFHTPWNRIICDESHRFSNPKTNTFVSIMGLYSKRKWCLSGTPIRNYSTDIYSQLRFCGYNSVVNEKNFNFEIYKRQCLFESILCKNYQDAGIVLPNVIEHNIELELDGEEKDLYDFCLCRIREEYKKFLLGSCDFSNILTMFLRLRQICISAYTMLPESDRKYKENNEVETYNPTEMYLNDWIKNKYGTSGIESKKISAIIEIIKKIPKGEKVLIFTSFKRIIDIISLAINTKLSGKKFLVLDGDVKGEKRDKTIDAFKDTELGYDIMLISYKVGSEGLNLIESNHIILCENWWTPVVQEQAKSRTHRIGQTRNINVWSIIVKNSIEERIEEICKNKKILINSFLDNNQNKQRISLDSYTMGRILKQ